MQKVCKSTSWISGRKRFTHSGIWDVVNLLTYFFPSLSSAWLSKERLPHFLPPSPRLPPSLKPRIKFGMPR